MSKTVKTLLVGLLAAGSIGAYWNFVLSPKRAEATELATKIAAQEAELAQTQALLSNYQKAKDAYRENYTTLVRLGKAIPADDDTRSLIVQLDAAAKRAGVDFENIDIGTGGGNAGSAGGQASATTTNSTATAPPGAVNAGAFSAMPFSFSFAGTYSGLSDFFARLERFVTLRGDKISVNGRLLRVESISLQPSDVGWPAIRAQIGASSYIVPLGQDPAAASAGTSQPGTSVGGTSTSTPSTSSTDASSPAPTTGDAQ